MTPEQESTATRDVAIVAVLLGWAFMTFVTYWLFYSPGLKEDRREQEAVDIQKLECRQRGGTMENFGTQGYHCIGGKQ